MPKQLEEKFLTVDTNTAIFIRESLVEYHETMASPALYAPYNFASGRYMPVVGARNPWVSEVVINEWDTFGIAAVMAPGSKDQGKVGVIARRMKYPVKTIKAFTEIPWDTVKQAESVQSPLSTVYSMALEDGINKKLDKLGYNGDSEFGLPGIFDTQLLRVNNATSLKNTSDPDVMLSTLNSWVRAVTDRSNGIWKPKILALPQEQHDKIATTYRDGVTVSVKDAFLASQQSMRQIRDIISDPKLRAKADDGTDAALVLPYGTEGFNEEASLRMLSGDMEPNFPIFFSLPMDFDVPAELADLRDETYYSTAIARTGSVIVTNPLAGAIVNNA